MSIINYKIHLNNQSFSKNKKNIVLLIRRSPGELDWIMPLLYSLRKKYNILTIFREQKTLNLIKNNKILFKLWNKTSFGYTIQPKLKSIVWRIGYHLFKKTILKNIFQSRFQDSFYDVVKISNLILNQKKKSSSFIPEAIFAEFLDFSPWLNKFYNQNKLIKIIHYPHTTNLFGIKKYKIKLKRNIKNRYLLLSNAYDFKFWHNKFLKSNIIEAGYLKYDKSWIKKIISKKIKKTRKIIYVSYSGFVPSKHDFEKYLEQTKNIMDICIEIPSAIILFKIHPITDKKKLLNILSSYPKNKWKLVNDNQIYLASICDVYIALYSSTASMLDCLAVKKIPIELWSVFRKEKERKSKSEKLNLSVNVKTKSALKNQIIKLLKKKKFDKQQLEIRQKFNKNFFTNGSIVYTKKVIGL